MKIYVCFNAEKSYEGIQVFKTYQEAFRYFQFYVECHECDRTLHGYYLNLKNYKNKVFLLEKEIP